MPVLHIKKKPYRRPFVLALAVQIGFVGVIAAVALGSGTATVVGQLFAAVRLLGAVYITFVPGALILTALQLDSCDEVEAVLYSVGLSLLTLMVVGIGLQILLPRGFQPDTLVAAVWVVSWFLLVVLWQFDRRPRFRPSWSVSDQFESSTARTALVLAGSATVVAIAGTQVVNASGDNLLLMAAIPLIGFVALYVGFAEEQSAGVYSVLIYLIALGLLYHRSLISPVLWGWDIHREYFFANIVVTHGLWPSSLPDAYNSMLSIVVIGPFYSLTSGMSLTWIFKIVYPALLAMVPVGLFQCYRRQIPKKAAFFSAFFFISYFGFYSLMPQLARQSIAEVFLALLLLTIVQRWHSRKKNAVLFVLLFAGIVVSHYGIALILAVSLVASQTVYTTLKRLRARSRSRSRLQVISLDRWSLNWKILAASISILVAWYAVTSNGVILRLYVRTFMETGTALVQQFFSPKSTGGAEEIAEATTSPLRSVEKGLHLTTQAAIGFGLLWVAARNQFPDRMNSIFGYSNFDIESDFLVLAGMFLLFAISGLTVPGVSSALNLNRFYQILLSVLAPFAVIGFSAGIRTLRTGANRVGGNVRIPNRIRVERPLRLVSLFFVIFLLFNTWWMYQVAMEPPGSISLGEETNRNADDVQTRSSLYGKVNTHREDVAAVSWLRRTTEDEELVVYTDYFGTHALTSYGGFYQRVSYRTPNRIFRPLSTSDTPLPRQSYLFVSYANSAGNVFLGSDRPGSFGSPRPFEGTWVDRRQTTRNKVYSSGNSSLYAAGGDRNPTASRRTVQTIQGPTTAVSGRRR